MCVWSDDAAIDAYLANHPFGSAIAGGYGVRLQPLREYGSCPTIGRLVDDEHEPLEDEPLAVFTYGRRIRLTSLPRFVRKSARANGAILSGEALLAGTLMTRPPHTFATFTLWRNLAGVRAVVEGRHGAHTGHREAMRSRAQDPFFPEDLFARLRPYGAYGLWNGRDPLADTRAAADAPSAAGDT